MSLHSELRRAHASDALLAFVEEAGEDEAWDSNDRGDWAIWMAAARGVPIGRIHDVAIRALTAVRKQLDGPAALFGTVDEALRVALERDEGLLMDLAERVEAWGEDAPQGYRDQVPAGASALARAAGLLVRAVEAVGAAHAALESRLQLEALTRAGAIGVAPALMQREVGELTLVVAATGDPLHEELTYAVDAAAEAMHEAAHAMARGDEAQLEEAEAAVADLLFEGLDALVGG